MTLGPGPPGVNSAGHRSHIVGAWDDQVVSLPPTAEPSTEPSRAVLQVSRAALLGVLVFLVGTGPFVAADTARWGWLVLLPLLSAAWVLRVRTTADADGLVARSTFRTRTVPWAEVDGVRFPRRGWGRAVLQDGNEVWLPGVGFHDLRLLAVASGGRVPDPFAAAEQARVVREAGAGGAEEAGATEPEQGPTEPQAPGLTW